MKQLVFGILYILIGLSFLLATLVTVSETTIEDKKSIDELGVVSSFRFR